jgi:hypothetical protein
MHKNRCCINWYKVVDRLTLTVDRLSIKEKRLRFLSNIDRTSGIRHRTSNRYRTRQRTSNIDIEQRTSNEQRTTNNEQRTTGNEQRTKYGKNIQSVILLGGEESNVCFVTKKPAKQYLDILMEKSLFEDDRDAIAISDKVWSCGNIDNCHLSRKNIRKSIQSILILWIDSKKYRCGHCFYAFAADRRYLFWLSHRLIILLWW